LRRNDATQRSNATRPRSQHARSAATVRVHGQTASALGQCAMTETKRSRFRSLPCLAACGVIVTSYMLQAESLVLTRFQPLQACRANPENNPTVCRGLKEEVKALFPNGADIEVILNVAEALAQKELELALAEQEIKNKEDLIFRLENDQLVERRKYSAILCNRHLLEMGLRRFSPGERMTRAYKEFATTHLFEKWGRTLMPKAKQVLTDIVNVTGLSVASEDVARDLKDLVHELSKDIHYPLMNETGFLCGGREPTGAAAAVALCILQANGCLDGDVIFVNSNYQKCAILTAGTIQPP